MKKEMNSGDGCFSDNINALPDWFEAKRVSDKYFLNAYENCPPRCRSALKTGIALTAFNFNSSLQEEKTYIRNFQKGFARSSSQKACDWTILVFDELFNAPARICAAIALPALANVPLIFAICLGRKVKSSILCGLELCGIGDVFCIDSSELEQFLLELSSREPYHPSRGKLVFLSEYFNPNIISYYSPFHIIYLPPKPNIKIIPDQEDDLTILKYTQNCLPDDFNPVLPVDCVIDLSNSLQEQENSIPLVLGKGCEGFWLYPGLSPLSFTLRQTCFSLLD